MSHSLQFLKSGPRSNSARAIISSLSDGPDVILQNEDPTSVNDDSLSQEKHGIGLAAPQSGFFLNRRRRQKSGSP